MSMSETDLYRSGRGRTRSCSEMLKSTSSTSYLPPPPPPPLQSVYHPSSYRSNLSYLPKPSFLWDGRFACCNNCGNQLVNVKGIEEANIFIYPYEAAVKLRKYGDGCMALYIILSLYIPFPC